VTAKDEKLEPGLAKNLISKAKNNGWSPPQDDETVIGAVSIDACETLVPPLQKCGPLLSPANAIGCQTYASRTIRKVMM
jgi:hypothetical protein